MRRHGSDSTLPLAGPAGGAAWGWAGFPAPAGSSVCCPHLLGLHSQEKSHDLQDSPGDAEATVGPTNELETCR